MQRWQSYRENPLTDTEQEKIEAVIGKKEGASNQRLTAKDLQIAAVQMLASLREVTHRLPTVGIKNFPLAEIAEELDVLETYHRGGEKKRRPKIK